MQAVAKTVLCILGFKYYVLLHAQRQQGKKPSDRNDTSAKGGSKWQVHSDQVSHTGPTSSPATALSKPSELPSKPFFFSCEQSAALHWPYPPDTGCIHELPPKYVGFANRARLILR